MIAAATFDPAANRWRFEGTVTIGGRAEMRHPARRDVYAAGGVLYFRCLPTDTPQKIGAFLNPRRLLGKYWDKVRAVNARGRK